MRIATAISCVLIASAVTAQTPAPKHIVTRKSMRAGRRSFPTGPLGKDDQIGALNLITPAKRKQAAALVKEGVSVSMAGDLDTEKP